MRWKALAALMLSMSPASAFNPGHSRVPSLRSERQVLSTLHRPRARGDTVYNFGLAGFDRRPSEVRMMANPDSKPTGLVWPSKEAEAKVRKVDGITLYPTHAWTDDMVPILPA